MTHSSNSCFFLVYCFYPAQTKHEHQNPRAGIVWDERKVIERFGGPPNNWSEQKTRHNIIDKLDASAADGSQFDQTSIMCYGFPPGLALEPENVRIKGIASTFVLSETDKSEVRKHYPPIRNTAEKGLPMAIEQRTPLMPFVSVALDVDNGGQRDFSLSVDTSRSYTIMTIGRNVDTVLVLLEEDPTTGKPITVAGSNDAGKKTTASLAVRLVRGRSYILRARVVYAPLRNEVAVLCY
jgi:hypothetical protein